MSNGGALSGNAVSPDTESASDTESVRSFNGFLDEKHDRRCGPARVWRRRFLGRRVGVFALGTLCCAVTGVLIWVTLVFTVPRRHAPPSPSSGINSVVQNWKSPEDSLKLLTPWPADFTRDIEPLACHSHNDYWRNVPLFDALAAGCTSIEADIWINDKDPNGDLLVGHSHRSLTSDRTLQTLYIKPLLTILSNQNKIPDTPNPVGIFSSSPNTTTTLFLDFKQSGAKIWPVLDQQLTALREGNWLSHWNPTSKTMIWRPLIIVASGDAPFDIISSPASNPHADIFYDAPLDDISNSKYDASNSYYASVSMSRALGTIWAWKFSSTQMEKIKTQIGEARKKGLVSRYWGAPTWPGTFNSYIWGVLVENGVGLLNVDGFSEGLYYPLVTRFGKNRLSW